MRLTILDPQGDPLYIEVSPETTIASLKSLLSLRVGADPSHQILHFRGSALSDSLSLHDYNIQSGTTVYLTVTSSTDDSVIDEMIHSPQVQSILRKSSCFFTEMELSEFLQDYFELSDSPHLIEESGRLTDQCLTLLEASASGLREISQSYTDFEESGIEAALFGTPEPEKWATVIGEDLEEPSSGPLPCLFRTEWMIPELQPVKPRTWPELNDGRCGRVVQPKRTEGDSSKR
jgi:hypothetical protein